MSSFTEQQKKQYKERLRNYRSAILNATEPRALRNKVGELEAYLQELDKVSVGDTQRTIQTTLEKIQQFRLYDTTRFEVCRWVQTIICDLNQL